MNVKNCNFTEPMENEYCVFKQDIPSDIEQWYKEKLINTIDPSHWDGLVVKLDDIDRFVPCLSVWTERMQMVLVSVFGSVVGDNEINTESNEYRQILRGIFSTYDSILNENAEYSNWKNLYFAILNEEEDMTEEFVQLTQVMSNTFYQIDATHISSFWDFMILLIGVFPKESYGSIEFDRLQHQAYWRLLEPTTMHSPLSKLSKVFTIDPANVQMKVMRHINYVSSVTIKPDDFSTLVPCYVAVGLLSTVYYTRDSESFKAMVLSLASKHFV